LPYLAAEIFHLLGFSYLDAIKLVYALAWIASGLTMYALARRFFSEPGAFLAAIVYVYLPYHIATVYVRGAFAESVAWAVMPAALLAAISYQRSAVSGQLPVASHLLFAIRHSLSAILSFAFLFLIQPGIAILFAFFAFAVIVALRWNETVLRRPSSVLRLLIPVIGGLALGALLYLPAILHNGTNIARDGFNPNFVFPFQLFSSLWGFGASTGSFLDQFPFQIGVAPIGLAIVAAALASRTNNAIVKRVLIVFVAAAIALAILTFEIAAPIWAMLGIFVTYPWQLLAFVGLALALVAGAAIEFDERLARPAMLAVFVALPIVASYTYLAPRFLDTNPTRPPIAIFGNNEIALWDYRIVGPLRHGATLRVQMTWQALRPVNHDYTVFVHAVHENGNTYAQEDSKPGDGALPTIKWPVGQVISDTHTIQIDVEGPSEGYHLEVGMYTAATGERALTETGTDMLILPHAGDPEPFVPTR
jgi:hypothetical protein